jgi:hypothetical protein
MRLQYLHSLEKEKARKEAALQKRLDFANGLKIAVDQKKVKGQDSAVSYIQFCNKVYLD